MLQLYRGSGSWEVDLLTREASFAEWGEKRLAHPITDLLEKPEALLFVNAVLTMLHYIDQRTPSCAEAEQAVAPEGDKE